MEDQSFLSAMQAVNSLADQIGLISVAFSLDDATCTTEEDRAQMKMLAEAVHRVVVKAEEAADAAEAYYRKAVELAD